MEAGDKEKGGRSLAHALACSLVAALLPLLTPVLAPPAIAAAQESATGQGNGQVSFSYKFENTRFYIPLIEVDMNADGIGEVRFKRGESDEIISLKLKLSPGTLARIRKLYDDTRFIDSAEDYQSKKDFSHLGWVTLAAREGERARTARFNYTMNLGIRELADIFRAIATQQMHLFDMDTAQQFQQLDLPRQLELLESDLRLERIAEPEQMIAPLRDIAGDDTLPLIARNHATRIVKDIEKNKYKSPMRK